MIAPMGGRFGGYGLYLLKGKPVFTYNLLDLERFAGRRLGARPQQALAPGKHTIVFDFKYDGPGIGKGGTGVLTVDGKEFAQQDDSAYDSIPHAIDETFRCRRRYARRWTTRTTRCRSVLPGKIDKLTFKLGPEQLTAEDQKAKAEAIARVNN